MGLYRLREATVTLAPYIFSLGCAAAGATGLIYCLPAEKPLETSVAAGVAGGFLGLAPSMIVSCLFAHHYETKARVESQRGPRSSARLTDLAHLVSK